MEFIAETTKFGKVTAWIEQTERPKRYKLSIDLSGKKIRGAVIFGHVHLEEITDPKQCCKHFGERWQTVHSLGMGWREIKKEGQPYGKLYANSVYTAIDNMTSAVVEFVDANFEQLKAEEQKAQLRSRYYYLDKEIDEMKAKVEAFTVERGKLLEQLNASQSANHPVIVDAIKLLAQNKDSWGFSDTDLRIGSWLIGKFDSPDFKLSADNYKIILELLEKYTAQLEKHHIKLPTIAEIEDFLAISAAA